MTATIPTTAKIELTIESSVATIALNRPQVRNAIDDEMRAAFNAAIERVANDDAVRALVLTGNGSAFCAGGDISAMQQRLAAPVGEIAFNGWRRQQRVHQSVAGLHGLGKPTIAAVNGAAAGLGADMALCCDFIIASEAASFAMSFIHRGLVPDGGGLYFLPRRVGLARAKELIFSGRRVAAAEALEIGLVDRLTSADKLLDDARAWAHELSRGSRIALALSKAILDKSFELSGEEVSALGREAQAICYTTTEHRESVEAFLNKKAR
jgi:enoyl-CoA hydratase/carnithine racemase